MCQARAGTRDDLPSGKRENGKPERKVSPWVVSHSFKHDRKLDKQQAALHVHACITLM